MMGTLAFDIIATTSVMWFERMAIANSASILPFFVIEKFGCETTKSISLSHQSPAYGANLVLLTLKEGIVGSATIRTV